MIKEVRKFTESEARKLVRKYKLSWELSAGEIIRQCSECGAYVAIEDFFGEEIINKETFYDICQDCVDRIKKGEAVEDFDADDCDELELCQYCDEPILDDEEIVFSGDDEPYHKDCALRTGS